MDKWLRVVATTQFFALTSLAQASPFDTLGPFVAYRLTGLPADEVSVNTSQSVAASGPSFSPDWGTFAPPAGAGQASVAGMATVGGAVVSVSASGDGFAPLVFAGWTDSLVIDAPGQTGKRGTMSFQVRYDWTTASFANPGSYVYAIPYVDLNFWIPGNAFDSVQDAAVVNQTGHDCYSESTCSRSDTWYVDAFRTSAPTFADGVATFTVNIVFGQTYNMTLGVSGSLPGFGGSAAVNASMLWNGVATVKDANGESLPNYAVTSAIGLDYRSAVTAVPEPRSIALWTVGLLALAGARRRRS